MANTNLHREKIKALAVSEVLKALGSGAYSLLNSYLMNAHGIWLEIEQSYSLPQLREALVKVLGQDSTELVLRRVYLKMEELAEDTRDSLAA